MSTINAPHLDIVRVANGFIVRPVRGPSDEPLWGRGEYPDTFVFDRPINLATFIDDWGMAQEKGKRK